MYFNAFPEKLLNETKNLYQTKNVFNLTAKSMKYSTTTKLENIALKNVYICFIMHIIIV